MANPNQEIKYTKLFINNEFVDSVSGKKFETVNPATGKVIVEVSEGDKADVDLAVVAAKKAFHRNSEWRTMAPMDRAALMNKLADLMVRDKNILANIEVLDNGKAFSDAIDDIDGSIQTLRYFAGWCDKIHGDTLPTNGDLITMTRKEPVGVVGQIIPWNFPIAMLAWKWGPALATGCTIVMKPAEQTPLSALHMAALAKESGFPAGVINIVNGFGPTAGAAIAMHKDIQKVAFTGSVEVGRRVMEAAAKSNLKRVSLELGGKSPLVIFDDVDVEQAALVAYNGIFLNQGQNCCAGSRTFVHEKIYDSFVKKAVELAKNRKVGNPFEKNVQHGPQISKEMMEKVLDYIKSGKQQGAKLECGGERVGDSGYFVAPTVFSNVEDSMKIAQEEIFGPVQSILKFNTLDEVIERANSTTYGLAAGIVTNDINKATKFAHSVEAGTVWVNCYDIVMAQTPFGGYKQSGIGRELGKDGVEDYLENKTITMKVL